MDTRLSQAWNGWRASARHKASTPDEPELHRFSDGAMHTALMAAVIAVAVMAVVQMVNVAAPMWQLEPVVVQGKAQQVPLPAAPQPLAPAQPGR